MTNTQKLIFKRLTWLLTSALAATLELGTAASAANVTGADLVVSGIAPSATEPPKVLVVIRNLGNRPVKSAFGVELWLDDQLLGRQRVQELKPGGPLHLVFMRPKEMARGLHNFTAKIDPQHEIKELSTGNNDQSITVWVEGKSGAHGTMATTQGRRGSR